MLGRHEFQLPRACAIAHVLRLRDETGVSQRRRVSRAIMHCYYIIVLYGRVKLIQLITLLLYTLLPSSCSTIFLYHDSTIYIYIHIYIYTYIHIHIYIYIYILLYLLLHCESHLAGLEGS